jgi:dienelactone hydrolase
MLGRRRLALVARLVLVGGLVPAGFVPVARAEPLDPRPIDCLGPVEIEDPEPGSAEWRVRESQNVYCATERVHDKAQHPLLGLAPDPSPDDPRTDEMEANSRDAYRVPSRQDDIRFRFEPLTVTNRDGLAMPLELYRPCTPEACVGTPGEIGAFDAPYPVVLVVPGGPGVTPRKAAPKEFYRWVAQSLAEAGYMTALFDVASLHLEDAEDVLDWVLATPSAPTPAGEYNPFSSEVDRDHIGIAGHSGGGATASRLGQLDDRFDAIASFDRSGRYALPESDADITTPALFFRGDYGTGIRPYQDDPDPDSTAKTEDYQRLRGLGVDTMHLVLRAASHPDWSTPTPLSGNRYAEVVTLYYTLAWFDRYLKPGLAQDAFGRLTADVFDASGDVHNISQGYFDPVQAAMSGDPYGGNVPYTVAGTAVADRLSFYFSSRCFITVPGSPLRATSDDMRTGGCPSGAGQ